MSITKERPELSYSCVFFAPIAFPEPLEIGIFGDKGYLTTFFSKNEIQVIKRELIEDVQQIGMIFSYRKKMNNSITFIIVPSKEIYFGRTGFVEEHRTFIDAIKTRKKPLTTVKECLYGTFIPLAAEEAMRTGKVVAL